LEIVERQPVTATAVESPVKEVEDIALDGVSE
jgi:hypothetical protein